jgi:hypothetical protein
MTELAAHLADLRQRFLALHTRKEDLFWSVKMGLSNDAAAEHAAQGEADLAYQSFIQDPERLATLRRLEAEHPLAEGDPLRVELEGWIRFFGCYSLEDAEARALSAEILAREGELAKARAGFATGYTDPTTGAFIPASTNKLALLIQNDPSEGVRKAALDGLYAVERFVLDHGFLDIVRLRNKLGRLLGYEDYYDWKVAIAEGSRKRDIFARLTHFLDATRDKTRQALAHFAVTHGADALHPYNFLHLRQGELAAAFDRHYPFSQALTRWGRSFAAMGVRYRGATLTLDLVDRAGKYENGFMHGPCPTWTDGATTHPARINFTANAVPGAIGSGSTAIMTLFHEGGHAAHFANIDAISPCFSVEFPPTSVAYAENWSMFFDSLIEDPDWRARYALDEDGQPVPWALIEREVREKQPFAAWEVARLIAVPLGERFIYELPESELTPERVLDGLRQIESETQGLSASARPILAVPHLLSGESSAYYHAYILAEMGVRQVRHHFLARDGYLTDNPNIGPELAAKAFAPGNRVTHDGSLVRLTGKPLSADALIADCNRSIDEALASARASYERGLATSAPEGSIELDAHIRVIHGKDTICDTADHPFDEAATRFATWIAAHA